jgi:hypothetical protein
MALTTREERMSIASTHWNPYLPIPNNSISESDKLQFMGIYSGFAEDDMGSIWNYITESNTSVWSAI